MDDQFMPLLPRRPTSPAAPSNPQRAELVPAEAASERFKPFTAANPLEDDACCGPEQPIVSLERTGERVSRIRIQCVCGQRIELECEY